MAFRGYILRRENPSTVSVYSSFPDYYKQSDRQAVLKAGCVVFWLVVSAYVLKGQRKTDESLHYSCTASSKPLTSSDDFATSVWPSATIISQTVTTQ